MVASTATAPAAATRGLPAVNEDEPSAPPTQPTALILEIQALNEAAATHLEDGFVDEAKEALSQATSKLSMCNVIQIPEEQQPTNITTSKPEEDDDEEPNRSVVFYYDEQKSFDESDDEHMSRSLSLSMHGSSHGTISSCGNDTLTVVEEDEDMPEFYPYPFTFQYDTTPEVQAQGTWVTLEQYRTCAITCMFNMALCHHLAWDDEPLKTQYLHQSLLFYQKAIALVLKKDERTGSCCFQKLTQEHPLLKLVLATCINASQCRSELVQYDKIVFWQNLIQTLLEPGDVDLNSSADLRAMKGYLAKHMQRHSQQPEISSPAA
mmetsp:Transcript_7445/g.15536  ORF Transcript_7445/g.15536 Transcript_7445/m.15536 type:complete len:321 (-) Transcript_7445:197-1159(-)|eukprot:CAMPEP_0172456392 /NCGR_PEP_ID=MMETSP1065-20121228/15440_1 /TAXON_ID=265537 /ORGANISM="Amphiprora paludosa, Strain CCMP125" /LENGTH=320 /DNA_ID=CAMNT_0013209349 /DNA_START=87 /DNA_END=1049 /DNA_ORIENTATION=+